MLPVYENDPLAALRPFPQDPQSYYAAHWHEIVISVLFYFGIQALSPIVSTKLFGNTYTSLNPKTKLNFDIHVVSMVQCFISIAIIVPAWSHPHIQGRADDAYLSIFGYTPYSGFISAITIGYFVWDSVVCTLHLKLFGVGFLLHGFAALFVFGCSLKPFCLPWVPAFLLFELSTPFVNINWFASKLPAGTISDRVVAINGICLLVTFFLVRILWGFYAVGFVMVDMYRLRGHAHAFFPFMVLSLNVMLNVLNVYWFSRMLAIAKKKITGGQSRKETIKVE
ncbi:CIC11C00000000592 [Sungouiella intermedia]|uniref:CIC11C00000000592 n=1 Tax=Sungouiella intermedia TaxID=45354 RepID=A0A1L0GRS6_9ASCO|nr:CIC11C00000000592 [[Candida] intermedia]SGZ58725.1 CIC11C00000003083 [[Candida] intermedia]